MQTTEQMHNFLLYQFCKLLVGATFILIFIGGLVTSTGSGLAVPDWPTTYGHFMFSFPFSEMVGGILYEHSHRMVATIVGILMTILAVWLLVKERRRWIKWFGLAALFAVIVQGILGGVTVLFKLPTAISVMHASLAQAFFCMTICLAMFTSKEWSSSEKRISDESKPSIQNLAMLATLLIFVQLILGAIMRHLGAGLAIPDFPLAFGKVIPPINSQAVAIHFLHRVGALFVTLSILWVAIQIFRTQRNQPKLMLPTITLLFALVIQILLAGITIWTQKAVLPTTAHVAMGAFVLGNSLFLTLRAHLLLQTKQQEEANYILKQVILKA